MKKILFVIPNLMHGGAERVLVNLVNAMDRSRFDITLLSLFDCGVNREDLANSVRYRFVYKKQFRGNSHYFKLFSPVQLYRKLIADDYDVVVAFLEGTAARIVSGCCLPGVKKVCWVHTSLSERAVLTAGFRSADEAKSCYAAFDRIVCVSESVRADFIQAVGLADKTTVLYNPIDGEKIRRLSAQPCRYPESDGKKSICAVGKLIPVKGFDRLADICRKLKKDRIPVHFYICGSGSEETKLRELTAEYDIADCFTLTGFLENPYAVLSRCDLFVCSSYREGFSSAACEALLCGVPVVTVAVQGMEELLGDNEYGWICKNDNDALYAAIRQFLTDDAIGHRYRRNAQKKGRELDMQKAVAAIETCLECL